MIVNHLLGNLFHFVYKRRLKLLSLMTVLFQSKLQHWIESFKIEKPDIIIYMK